MDEGGVSEPTQVQLQQYAVVAGRRVHMDGLVWQAPVLILTAEAFLFTIALGPSVSVLARVTAGLLAALVAGLGWELMGKHRALEHIDAEWLKAFEKKFGMSIVHRHPRELTEWTDRFPSLNRSSANRWRAGLLVFGAVGLAVVALSLLAPGQF